MPSPSFGTVQNSFWLDETVTIYSSSCTWHSQAYAQRKRFTKVSSCDWMTCCCRSRTPLPLEFQTAPSMAWQVTWRFWHYLISWGYECRSGCIGYGNTGGRLQQASQGPGPWVKHNCQCRRIERATCKPHLSFLRPLWMNSMSEINICYPEWEVTLRVGLQTILILGAGSYTSLFGSDAFLFLTHMWQVALHVIILIFFFLQLSRQMYFTSNWKCHFMANCPE